MTLPSQFQGGPITSSVFSAETTYLDQRHDLAEARARLAQVEAEADASEEDRIAARNTVLEAERAFFQADKALQKAKLDATGESLKQTETATEGFGAALGLR
jgi:hypothetical protein